ncbi:MAG: hypothetical protein AABZ85_05335 [Thermodesulfobacteriota bacterium]
MEDLSSRIVQEALSLGCQDAVAEVVTNRSYQIRFARKEVQKMEVIRAGLPGEFDGPSLLSGIVVGEDDARPAARTLGKGSGQRNHVDGIIQ